MKYAQFITALGLFAAATDYPNKKRRGTYIPKPSPVAPLPRGTKKYVIDGIEVIAISEKSARKKVERRLKSHENRNT